MFKFIIGFLSKFQAAKLVPGQYGPPGAGANWICAGDRC